MLPPLDCPFEATVKHVVPIHEHRFEPGYEILREELVEAARLSELKQAQDYIVARLLLALEVELAIPSGSIGGRPFPALMIAGAYTLSVIHISECGQGLAELQDFEPNQPFCFRQVEVRTKPI